MTAPEHQPERPRLPRRSEPILASGERDNPDRCPLSERYSRGPQPRCADKRRAALAQARKSSIPSTTPYRAHQPGRRPASPAKRGQIPQTGSPAAALQPRRVPNPPGLLADRRPVSAAGSGLNACTGRAHARSATSRDRGRARHGAASSDVGVDNASMQKRKSGKVAARGAATPPRNRRLPPRDRRIQMEGPPASAAKSERRAGATWLLHVAGQMVIGATVRGSDQMRLLMIGALGAGKGTQAERLPSDSASRTYPAATCCASTSGTRRRSAAQSSPTSTAATWSRAAWS